MRSSGWVACLASAATTTFARPARAAGYLRHGSCFCRAPERLGHERVELRFDRDQVWIVHRGAEVARYPRSYEQGVWLPPPVLRPEPPAVPPPPVLPRLTVAPP